MSTNKISYANTLMGYMALCFGFCAREVLEKAMLAGGIKSNYAILEDSSNDST